METYFIQNTTNRHIKIGIAENSHKRLANLQTANSEPLVLLGVLDGDREPELHAMFRKYRVRGEWFEPAFLLTDWIKSNVPMAERLKSAKHIERQIPTATILKEDTSSGVECCDEYCDRTEEDGDLLDAEAVVERNWKRFESCLDDEYEKNVADLVADGVEECEARSLTAEYCECEYHTVLRETRFLAYSRLVKGIGFNFSERFMCVRTVPISTDKARNELLELSECAWELDCEGWSLRVLNTDPLITKKQGEEFDFYLLWLIKNGLYVKYDEKGQPLFLSDDSLEQMKQLIGWCGRSRNIQLSADADS